MSEVDEIVARLRRGELAYKSGSTAVYHGPTVFDTKVAETISQLQAEIAQYREALRSAETALASEYEIRGEFDTTYPLPVGPILSVVRAALGSVTPRKFSLGHRVHKISGSSWRGHVVGFYSTSLTPIGYNVESEHELGSVQLYPESALVRAAVGGSND